MIPYGRQDITQEDIDCVVDVLKSDYITQGPQVPAFEKSLCDYSDAKYALAVNSATSALHIACLALGLKSGDWLWTSPITFVASANCGLYCGARVDFVDVDERTYNICPVKMRAKLEVAKKKNQLPKVVIPVHFTGQPCDMESIYQLSKEYGFFVIEDASHAIGGSYKNKRIGSCQYSDITIFSFHPVKIITTAEGGAALTNDSVLASKMDLYRSHGVTRDPELMVGDSHGPWYYQQVDLGFNYRMTELQAALGVSQMKRLNSFVTARHEVSNNYNVLLKDLPIVLPYQLNNTYSGLHLYVIRLKLSQIRRSHREVFEQLRAKGVGVNLHYIPVHLQPYYKEMGFLPGDFPNAESYYSEAISLPMFPMLSAKDQGYIVSVLKEVLC